MKTQELEQHIVQHCGAQPLELRLRHGHVRFMVSRLDAGRRIILHDSEGRCHATGTDSLAWYAVESDPDTRLQVFETLNGWTVNGEPLTRMPSLDLSR